MSGKYVFIGNTLTGTTPVTVSSITDLRSIAPVDGGIVITAGYYDNGDGGAGMYYYDPSDTSSADNGGTVIVGASSSRWKLIYSGSIIANQFGAKGNGIFDDVTYLQTWVNFCATNKLRGDFGSGNYSISAPLSFPNNSFFVGKGMGSGNSTGGTNIVPTSNAFIALINATGDAADMRNVRLENFRVIGGLNNIKLTISGTMSGCSFKKLWLSAPANDNFLVTQMVISTLFEEIVFDATPSTYTGFKVAAANANNIHLKDCWWIESDGASIDLASGEDILITNPRFEAQHTPGASGGTVIKFASVKAWKIIGGYVENTFVNFLTETSSTSTGVIEGVRFSGAEYASLANTFTSDGIVTFGACQFNIPSNAPAQVLLSNPCSGLLTANSAVWVDKSDSHIAVGTKQISITASGTAEDLFTFTRANTNNADNQQSLTGWLIVSVVGKTGGGTKCYMSIRVPFLVDGFANATMSMTTATPIISDDNAVGGTLTAGLKAGATNTDCTVYATFTLAGMGTSNMYAYLDVLPLKNPSFAHITVTPVAS